MAVRHPRAPPVILCWGSVTRIAFRRAKKTAAFVVAQAAHAGPSDQCYMWGIGGSWPVRVERLFISPAPDPLLASLPAAFAPSGASAAMASQPASQPASVVGMVGVRPPATFRSPLRSPIWGRGAQMWQASQRGGYGGCEACMRHAIVFWGARMTLRRPQNDGDPPTR